LRECGAHCWNTKCEGIRTSLPFFQWMLRQTAFVAGEFHTEFLDELLQRRGVEGFSDVDPSLEEVAAIAACIADAEDQIAGRSEMTGPTPTHGSATAKAAADRSDRPALSWKNRARVEGLRG
jgi:acetyl/propionyl-CoA carboxylase alpha subunit